MNQLYSMHHAQVTHGTHETSATSLMDKEEVIALFRRISDDHAQLAGGRTNNRHNAVTIANMVSAWENGMSLANAEAALRAKFSNSLLKKAIAGRLADLRSHLPKDEMTAAQIQQAEGPFLADLTALGKSDELRSELTSQHFVHTNWYSLCCVVPGCLKCSYFTFYAWRCPS